MLTRGIPGLIVHVKSGFACFRTYAISDQVGINQMPSLKAHLMSPG